MTVLHGSQFPLEFQPSVRQRFSTLRQCLHHVVLQDPRGMKAVAADCDFSESELSRRLAPKTEGDPRSCDVDEVMIAVMRSTKSLLPLQWILGEFEPQNGHREDRLLNMLESMAPAFFEAAAELKRVRQRGKKA